MKQNKFTPGPWFISGIGPKGSERVIYKATDTTSYPVAVVKLDHLDRFGTGDTDATARLISACPEMLEALKNAEFQLSMVYVFAPHVLIEAAIKDCQTAIAKATGVMPDEKELE